MQNFRFTRLSILLTLCIVFTTGCSLYRLGLRYLDWAVVREARKTFDLSSEQSANLKNVVRGHMPWFRQQWVPKFTAAMAKFEQRSLSEAELAVEPIEAFIADVKQLRNELIDKLSPELSVLILTLSEKQLLHASKHFKEKNEKWTDLLAKSDEILEDKRRDKLADSVKSWYGTLADSQEDEICQLFGCKREDVLRSLRWSELTQSHMLSTFGTVKTSRDLVKALQSWSQTSMLPPSEHTAWQERNRLWPERLAKLDKLMTLKQRQKARQKFQEVREDLEWFSRQ